MLDGDELRRHLTKDLGFSAADRRENLARIGYVARMLAGHGVKVLVAAIAPYTASRTQMRQEHAEAGIAFLEVHVATELRLCAQRDVKGLYARQAAGRISGLTGVDAPYEPPEACDLRIDTEHQSIAACTDRLHALLAVRGLA